jgi:hypothetical protein
MLKFLARVFIILVGSAIVWLPVILHLIGHEPPVYFNLLGVVVVIEPLTTSVLICGIILTGLAIFLSSPEKKIKEEQV